MKKSFLLLMVFLFTSTPCFALKEYFAISRSIRALGMGGAFYGLSDDEYALFYNPAGLSVYRGNGQGMLSINSHMSTNLLSAVKTLTSGENSKADQIVTKILDFQGKPFHGGVGVFPYYMRKHFAIGLLIAEPKFDAALLGKDFNSSLEIAAVSDTGLVAGYATSFMDDLLHIGLNVKGIYRAGGSKSFAVSDFAKKEAFKLDAKELGGAGGGVDFDLGATYELPELPYGILSRASLVFNNMLASRLTIARMEGPPPGLPRTMSLGWYTAFPGWQVFDNFHLLVDFAEFRLGGEENPERGARTGSFWKHVNVGMEAPMNGWFIPRIGLHQGYISAGLGINLRVLRLDFATYAEELSSTPGRLGNRRFALRLQIGGGAASLDPIVTRGKPEQGPSESAPVDEKPKAEEAKEEKKDEGATETAPTPLPTPTPDGRKPKSEEPPARLMEPRPEAEKLEGGERDPQGEPADRFNVEKEEPASAPARKPDTSIPQSESTPNDRFGIDKMKEETPGTP